MVKKNYKYFLISIFTLLISMLCSKTVYAAPIAFEHTGIKYERSTTSGGRFSDEFKNYSINGEAVFCIEPEIKTVDGHDYTIGSIDDFQATNEQKKRVLLIGHYGYNYPGHQTQKFRAATQALIWETMLGEGSWVKFNTDYWSRGEEVDISYERSEIEKLIAHHTDKPSFNSGTYSVAIGQQLELEDTNNVLSNYEVYTSDNANVIINGNKLIITTEKTGNVNIRLIKKQHYTKNSIFYVDPVRQKLMTAGAVDPVVSSVNINSLGGKVDLEKYDSGKIDIKSSATLKGASYYIYDENDNFIQELITDGKGHALSDYLPHLGRYYLKEMKASEGYQVNPNKIFFEITADNLIAYVRTEEEVITRDFDITKVYATDKTMIMTPEVGKKFGIYDKEYNLIKTLTTDKDGKMYITLPYGSYILKQLTTTDGYELIDDYHFEVKELGKENLVFSNAGINAKLKVIKVDKDSKKVIERANIKFKIYDVDRQEFVKQTITYPTAQTLEVFETDSNGILITPYALQPGTYRLIEVDQAIDKYLWNQEYVEFVINDDTDFIKDKDYGTLIEVKFFNTQVKGKVDITKYGEKIIIENGTFHYEKIKIDGVKYKLYANEDIISGDGTIIYNKDELIGTYETKDGFLEVADLYLGKYYFLEEVTLGSHVLDTTKYEFELVYKDQYTPVVHLSLTFNNYLKKGSMIFNKTDLLNGTPVPNTKVQLFTNNDNEERQLIFEGYTNELGKIILDNLPISKYILFEVEPADNYIINTEPIEFEIKENNETIELSMTNEKIEMPETFDTDIISISIIGATIILGVGILLYAKKKNK